MLAAIYDKGWDAAEAREERISPYDRSTSGPRWRTFAHAWIEGYDAWMDANDDRPCGSDAKARRMWRDL